MTRPVAVRSLQCEDHARNMPPTVVSVLWMLGKRCNFDCSYCPPHTHDSVSPFVDVSRAKDFVEAVHDYCETTNRRVKWAFTGGEPFLDPGFDDIYLRAARSPACEQIGVTTNGSLPLSVYTQAAAVMSHISFSIHLERSAEEIQDILHKCREIQHQCNLSVNLMYLPGSTQQVDRIRQQLIDQHTPFVVRKITPPVDSVQHLPYTRQGNGRKNINLSTMSQQSTHKIMFKQNADQIRQANIDRYYSESDQKYLLYVNAGAAWHNCGVWFDDGSYEELNSDHLLSHDWTNFNGWICYAGVDSLYVDFDGQIYRANCMYGEHLGRIGPGVAFVKDPIRCGRQCCQCSVDIPIRKALDTHLDRISHEPTKQPQ